MSLGKCRGELATADIYTAFRQKLFVQIHTAKEVKIKNSTNTN